MVIDGQATHFAHVKSPRPGAIPLLLTHGWPVTVFEFLDVVGSLTNPPDPAGIAFDLDLPSIPGMGLSGPTSEPGAGIELPARGWS